LCRHHLVTSGCVKHAAGTLKWFSTWGRPLIFSTAEIPCTQGHLSLPCFSFQVKPQTFLTKLQIIIKRAIGCQSCRRTMHAWRSDYISLCVCVCVPVCIRVCVCMCAYARACVLYTYTCVCLCASMCIWGYPPLETGTWRKRILYKLSRQHHAFTSKQHLQAA